MLSRAVLALVVLCAVFALAVAVASAGDGNSANAKVCQDGGWKTFVRSDGTSFANEGECVSWAAFGNTLVAKSKFDCEYFGGTYATGTAPVLWTCNGWLNSGREDALLKESTLAQDCFADGGVRFETIYSAVPGTGDSTCSSVL
jgi:hypothetical protein